MSVAAHLSAYAALLIVIGAAVFDIVRLEIPDGASLGVLGLALIFGLLAPRFGWWSHFAAPLLVFGLGLLAFSRGWLGGGDIKLLTAIAAWTGLTELLLLLTAVAIAGGLLALGVLVARRVIASPVTGPDAPLRAAPLPYAVAIAFGTLWWLWSTSGGPLAVYDATGDIPAIS